MLLTSIQAVCNLSGPFWIRPLIQYIKSGENAWADYISFFDTKDISWLAWLTPEKQYGVTLALLLVFT